MVRCWGFFPGPGLFMLVDCFPVRSPAFLSLNHSRGFPEEGGGSAWAIIRGTRCEGSGQNRGARTKGQAGRLGMLWVGPEHWDQGEENPGSAEAGDPGLHGSGEHHYATAMGNENHWVGARLSLERWEVRLRGGSVGCPMEGPAPHQASAFLLRLWHVL